MAAWYLWRSDFSHGGSEGGLSLGRKGLSDVRVFPAPLLKNLVLVAGHSVFIGTDFNKISLESSWFLESYQKVKGEANSFLEHIKLGVKAASQDPTSLLLFSGGQTRAEAGPRSEGLSYWLAAEAGGWFGHQNVRSRSFTEEHARDSFENLLFSLCRFYELTGHYPERITVISYQLKRDRFVNVHRQALRFPVDQFEFIGTDLPPDVKGAEEGEASTIAAFHDDPYGCAHDLLKGKRLKRDPFAVGPIHPSRCPAISELLTYCGSTVFKGELPW